MTKLDREIESAIANLNARDRDAKPFDSKTYTEAFRESAREKANVVLERLREEHQFSNKKPFYVSIGGGDGEELDMLLRNSAANEGVLIEMVPELAGLAGQRRLPDGKSIHVIPMPAQGGIDKAMNQAVESVKAGKADVIVVTCHAVLHELFDRGGNFDPVDFFGKIFVAPEVPILFTYREPGAPEKWPEAVLISADCSPASLLKLSNAIIQRHRDFQPLSPKPSALGDGIRVHRILGMEILAKLFYLRDLRHELEERVTVVDHGKLQNALWTAIGDHARFDHRAEIKTFSAPTKSFAFKWAELKVIVNGLRADHSSFPLGIPEAQTRVVAWRVPEESPKTIKPNMPSDVATACEAFETSDQGLLQSILLSRGRSWVEATNRGAGTDLLRQVAGKFPPNSISSLWSRYLLSIQELFGGNYSALAFFQRPDEVKGTELPMLFLAEQMEYLRKQGKRTEALQKASELAAALDRAPRPSTELEHYVLGTSHFLVSNFLRFGGRYQDAMRFIESAEAILHPNIVSHATELAHCFYAKQVCIAMTGLANFSVSKIEISQQFAGALVEVSYSHAAWFIGDIERAQEHAGKAAMGFERIGKLNYAKRAQSLLALLQIWRALERGKTPDFEGIREDWRRGVAALISGKEPEYVSNWLSEIRPSLAVGLMQLAKKYSKTFDKTIKLHLPPILLSEGRTWKWSGPIGAGSLHEADLLLRRQIGIPEERLVPLVAD